jgi:glycogen synthase
MNEELTDRKSHRIFYAAGPGNVISAHDYWSRGEYEPTEVSITFSSQIQDYCKQTNSPAYIVAYRSPPECLRDGLFILEHRPKPMPGSRGLQFHIAEALYVLGLLKTAVEFKATVAIIDSGSSHFFMGWLFRLARIPVVTVLHNTIWPSGFHPTRPIPKLIHRLDALFFRRGSSANIGVSPECVRQVDQLTKGHHGPLYEIRAQFLPERFRAIAPPPPFDGNLLRIMFIGRINRIKGVFDILEMAKKLNEKFPGRVYWEICGTGPDFKLLLQKRDEMALRNVDLLGWVSIEKLQEVYGRSHVSIVPTRSDFAEGLAMTAAEAILAGRPLITNATVPALEVLRPASLEGRTNDVDSYVEAIVRLINNPAIYKSLCEECVPLQAQFYDRSRGLTAVLSSALAALFPS